MDRKALGNILVVVAVIALMVGLNLVLYVDKRQDTETEDNAERSTYSGRNFGLLGYYTLLEESNLPVSRWRQPYTELEKHSNIQAVFIVAPPAHLNPSREEIRALLKWVEKGGTAVVVDRSIALVVGETNVATAALSSPRPQQDADPLFGKVEPGIATPWQPVNYFQAVEKIAVCDRAATLTWFKTEPRKPKDAKPAPAGTKKPPVQKETEAEPEDDFGTPEDEPTEAEDSVFAPLEGEEQTKAKPLDPTAQAWKPGFLPLAGVDDLPVFGGLRYGNGTVLFLSDQFILANNGIRQADNVVFGLNLANGLISGKEVPATGGPRIVFDEYHHGYRDGAGATYVGLSKYFSGTVVPLAFWQLAAVGLVAIYTFGRRFARPLPVKRMARASTLEYVSAMAQIQQVAESYDLAIENVYTRFHRALCRYGGVPTNTTGEKLSIAVARRARMNPDEIRLVVRRSEDILNGKATTEAEMVQLARKMRELEHKLGITKGG